MFYEEETKIGAQGLEPESTECGRRQTQTLEILELSDAQTWAGTITML